MSRRRPRRGASELTGRIGALIVIAFALLAIVGPLILPHAPNVSDPTGVLAGPSWSHPFGQDEFGRDLVARVFDAVRLALIVGTVSVVAAALVGTALGLVAGYRGGIVDAIVSGLFEVMFGLPALLFAIVLTAVIGTGLSGSIIAIAVVLAPRFGRIARSSARAIRALPYVEAARLSGLPPWRILSRHVLRNSLSPLVVLAGLNISVALLTYASLSFLGLGVAPPQADLGGMLASARNLMVVAPHLAVFPALVFVMLIVGFNLLGDWIRERLDPHSSLRAPQR